MKYLASFALFFTVLSGVATLICINTSIAANAASRTQEQKLSRLESNYQELKSQYLKNLLAHIEPKAEAAGFVAVVSPRFITSDTAVSFLTAANR